MPTVHSERSLCLTVHQSGMKALHDLISGYAELRLKLHCPKFQLSNLALKGFRAEPWPLLGRSVLSSFLRARPALKQRIRSASRRKSAGISN